MGLQHSQPAFTYSKSTIETPKQILKFSQVNTKDTSTTSLRSFRCLCYISTDFTSGFGVSNVAIEHLNPT